MVGAKDHAPPNLAGAERLFSWASQEMIGMGIPEQDMRDRSLAAQLQTVTDLFYVSA